MLKDILNALKTRKDITAWTVRHIISHGAQIYAIPQRIESQRTVGSEKYKIDVLCQTSGANETVTVGSGDVTLLPSDDIKSGIDRAALVASLVSNPVHTIPALAPHPHIPLADEDLKKDPLAIMQEMMEKIRSTASKNHNVHLTAAEGFGDIETTQLVNSRGIDVEQEATSVAVEFVLHGQQGERETEIFREMRRRRVADLDSEAEIEQASYYTLDSLKAGSPPTWQGPVVLRKDTLSTFMAGDALGSGVLRTLGSAASKYGKISSWEIGKSVFRGDVKGDPLTVWANRSIPYGTTSDRFDDEGLPAQRVPLIRENELVTFSASQQYADYLQLAPTGAFGGVELAPGQTQASALLVEPHIEVIQFSWFNPDPITGDFATEIRLGYVVENGVRRPFKGGQLIGNYMDALADVHWSIETAFYGNYLGPHTARFNNLRVAGDIE